MFSEPRQKLLELSLQRLGNQSLRTFAQHRAQQIALWLTQWNYRILLHGGVTPFVDAEIDLDNRIPAGHAAFFNSSSYTRFGYTSFVFSKTRTWCVSPHQMTTRWSPKPRPADDSQPFLS